eukprot:CAMPEP_0181211918 /NCGR_PEP_ID=MMETSP1096-20121128/24056_1 /TAXON_ID=156174 ORGANISM="Chrysochromulina ericina, Strain CCMP281" /NCGR_SAMPLE_ID=MMETSP1096 /ASSEMBLY_ACC=CAM_ASM_000453 /LENGTH=50 /DNA_ID=CAMNT_0023303379 /DNA_START=305 /DNA_END=457 /DNA_ORIENTATION=+
MKTSQENELPASCADSPRHAALSRAESFWSVHMARNADEWKNDGPQFSIV